MIGKKFTNLADGSVVEIKDMFEDIIILDNNSKIKTGRIFDKRYYEEYIDPSTFFQNQSLLNSFAQKIKQIPDEVINNIGYNEKEVVNESISSQRNAFDPFFSEFAVIPSDPELERLELMRKYNIQENKMDVHTQAQMQIEKFQSILNQNEQDSNEEVIRIEVNEEELISTQEINTIQKSETKVKEIDPIITMFKNVKRNRDFNISIQIENKIPRLDFIEMMEDSYNTSIIEFLSEEFTELLLKDIDSIKARFVTEIKNLVYNKEKNTEEVLSEIKKTEPTIRPKAKTTRTKKMN